MSKARQGRLFSEVTGCCDDPVPALRQGSGRASASCALLVYVKLTMLELVVEAHVVHSLEDIELCCGELDGSLASSALELHSRSMPRGALSRLVGSSGERPHIGCLFNCL